MIAEEVKMYWPKPYFGAVPYLDAMLELENVSDYYGADSGKSVVIYFLANAQTWQGPEARSMPIRLIPTIPVHRAKIAGDKY
jgi:hypothetical protein